jgi:hypothetical protein
VLPRGGPRGSSAGPKISTCCLACSEGGRGSRTGMVSPESPWPSVEMPWQVVENRDLGTASKAVRLRAADDATGSPGTLRVTDAGRRYHHHRALSQSPTVGNYSKPGRSRRPRHDPPRRLGRPSERPRETLLITATRDPAPADVPPRRPSRGSWPDGSGTPRIADARENGDPERVIAHFI